MKIDKTSRTRRTSEHDAPADDSGHDDSGATAEEGGLAPLLMQVLELLDADLDGTSVEELIEELRRETEEAEKADDDTA